MFYGVTQIEGVGNAPLRQLPYMTLHGLLATCGPKGCGFWFEMGSRLWPFWAELGYFRHSGLPLDIFICNTSIPRKLTHDLRIKTESTRSSSNKWTKTLYQNYFHCIATFCRTVLNIFSKKPFLATPKVENECWTLYETLESSGEMKLMMKFSLCLHKISELWNVLSLVPVGNCFRCYFRQLFMYLALRKCKNDCKILKITLVCPLKPEIAQFSIGFLLNWWNIKDLIYATGLSVMWRPPKQKLLQTPTRWVHFLY